MRLDRLLTITILLINRDRVSASDLTDRFEVSVRTIYRDIEALSLAGIPVISYPGNNGGFGLVENYRWDRQLLTMNDMVAMLTALKGVNETLKDDELDVAIEKVTSLVPSDRSDDLRESLDQFVVDMEPWGGAPRRRERVQLLHRAVVQHRCAQFTYSSSKGEDSSREVEPMTLILKGYTWYLFAFCRSRDDYRIFRLSRLRDLELTNERFSRRPGSYRDYMVGDRPEDVGPQAIDLHLRFQPAIRFLVEDYFDEAERVINPDGTIDVSVQYPDGEWLYSMILSYGDQVEVRSPVEVRANVARCAQRVAELYKKPPQT
jgi:predicted DNA-binding transcriptional regulator YafY